MKHDLDDKIALLVNGTLDPEERAAVEAAVEQEPELQQEAEFLSALRKGLHEAGDQDQSPGELGLARLKNAVQSEKKSTSRRVSPAWKRLAVAACAILSLQSAFLITQQFSPSTNVTTLSGHNESGLVLQVVFRDDASAAQIQSAVLQVEGSIIAGPSALGVYRIAVPESAQVESARQTLAAFPFVAEAVRP